MDQEKKYDTENNFNECSRNYYFEEDPLNLGGTENLYGLANEAETLGLNNLSIDDLESKKFNYCELDDEIVMITDDLISDDQNIFLEIVEQPITKFRFRYRAEMQGTHGQLKGIHSENKHKTFPTVKLHGYSGVAAIQCSVHRPDSNIQTHRLLTRTNNKSDSLDPIELLITSETEYTAEFRGMGIMFIKKDDIEQDLIKSVIEYKESKLKKKISKTQRNEIEKECKLKTRSINMNEIRLCFTALVRDEKTGTYVPLCDPVLSDPIQHSMGTKTGNLKICHLSRCFGKATGDEEIILLTEKVDKDNIKVRFFQLDNNEKRIWMKECIFPTSRVHRQYAIILRTPPYQNLEITEPTNVYIELFRPGKGNVVEESSEPFRFTYLPCEVCPRKRKKLSIESNSDLNVPIKSEEDEICEKSLELSLQYLIDNFDNDPNLCNENFVEKVDSRDLINVDKNLSITFNNNILMENESLNTLNFRSLTDVPHIFDCFILHHYISKGRIVDAKKVLKIVLVIKQLKLLQRKNDHDETCLHVACTYQEHDIAKSLIKAGVDPNIKNKEGNAALHLSIEKLDICMVSTFCDCIKSPTKLSKSLDKNLINHDSMSYLHLAIKKSSLPIVKKLIEIGASTNICTTNNKSNVLHLAVEQEDEKILSYLMTKVDRDLVYQKNSIGETPISLAKSMGKDSYLRIICKDEAFEISRNICDKSNYLDVQTLKTLSIILNKNEKWKKLVDLLNLGQYLCVWRSAETLLNHINRPDSGIQTEEIVAKLKELNEPDIEDIINKYVNDVIGIK